MSNSTAPFSPATSSAIERQVVPPFDVERLIESSQPHRSASWFPPAMGIFLLAVIGGSYWASRAPGTVGSIVDALSGVLTIGIGIAVALTFHATVKKHRTERSQIESIGELLQLRHWAQAGMAIQSLLSKPTRTATARVQGLIYLSSVLTRFERFDDAIYIQEYLLDTFGLDPSTEHALRLGRAMAMLRDEHLFDADRAISDLRRDVARHGAPPRRRVVTDDAPSDAPAPDDAEPIDASEDDRELPAGLALIEIYRDVKTGHPSEAIATFNKSLPAMRKQLGHRIADGYALVARAFDFLGQRVEAQANFERATLLAPWPELLRRYPELKGMIEKYRVATAPAEAA